jgi:hypothetical protein
VGDIVFTVSLDKTECTVRATCPLPDGTRFQMEAFARDRAADGQFRIRLLGASPGQDALPLCPQPPKDWGWTDSAQLDGMPAPAPSFRRLAEDAFAAVVLAAPRLFEAKRVRIWKGNGPDVDYHPDPRFFPGEDGRQRQLDYERGVADRAWRSARGYAEGGAHHEKMEITDGPVGGWPDGSPAAVSDERLAPVMAAAASAPMPPSAVALARYAISQDGGRTFVSRDGGTYSGSDQIWVPDYFLTGRTVACAGALPARALRALVPGIGEPAPAGACVVYGLGARTVLSLARPGDPAAQHMDAVLWVRQRTLRDPRCFLLFGGRSTRFDKTAQIADPGMRALAGIMLRAREIALADIADAPVRMAREEQAAKAQALAAAGQAAAQLPRLAAGGAQALSVAVPAGSAAATALPGAICQMRTALSGRLPSGRELGTAAAPAPVKAQSRPDLRCLACGVEEAGHACLYAADMPVPPPASVEQRAVLAGWSGGLAATGAVGAAASLAAAALFPPALILLVPIAAASATAAVASRAAVWALARKHAAAQPVAAEPAGPDPLAVLRAALLRANGRVSPVLAGRLRHVRADIETGLARPGDALGPDAYILRESALRYLPDAIDGYLSLQAGAPDMLSGRTAEQELDYQVGLIEARVQQALDGGARGLAGGFEAHGRFLQERLAARAPGSENRPSPAR